MDTEFVDLEKLRQEIDEFSRVPYEQRQKGDISIRDIMAAYGCSETSARGTLNRMIESGKYIAVQVRSYEPGKGTIKVARKAK